MATPSPKRRRIDEDDERSPSRRPSFMSPTKASIARFNPNLLNLPKPATPHFSETDYAAISNAESTSEDPDQPSEQESTVMSTRSISGLTHPPQSTAKGLSTPGLFITPKDRPNEAQALHQENESAISPSWRHTKRDHPEDSAKQVTETVELADVTESAEIGEIRSNAPTQSQQPPTTQQSRESEKVDGEAEARCVAKRGEREKLLQELRRSRHDNKQLENHLELNHDIASSTRNIESLTEILSSMAPSTASVERKILPTTSSMLSYFLPFSRPVDQAFGQNPSIPNDSAFSHEPLMLEDPLPYLSLFSSLTFTEEVAPLSECLRDGNSNSFKEVHSISVQSPLNLLSASLLLTTISTNQESLTAPLPEVCGVSITELSAWASVELLPVVQRHAQDHNVTHLCCALDTYWKLCLKRAECWIRCERAFSHLQQAGLSEDKENELDAVKTTRKTRNGKRKAAGNEIINETANKDNVDVQSTVQNAHKLSRSDLRPNLGRSNFIIKARDVHIRISWDIQFDWTGEAESVVTADTHFPGVWREADDRGSLKNISHTFDQLVRSRGVFGATEILVGLLI